MAARVRLRTDDSEVIELYAGDLIGRVWLAAWRIDDPRVSEAHGLVSLRGDHLRLLALRGRFTVDGRRVDEVDLVEGLRVDLAPGLGFTVLDVHVPAQIPALSIAGGPAQVLPGAVSLFTAPDLQIGHPTRPDAVAWVWRSGEHWRVRHADGRAQTLQTGVGFRVNGVEVCLVEARVRASEPTIERSAVRPPLKIVARYETVHLHRRSAPAVVLDGLSARLVSELVSFGVPVPWQVLAEALWGREPDAARLRKRLDNVMGRLRESLRDAQIRDDLVRANGLGQIELLLDPEDRVDAQL